MEGRKIRDYDLIMVYVQAHHERKGWRWILNELGLLCNDYDKVRKNSKHLQSKISKLRKKITLPKLSNNSHDKISPTTMGRNLGNGYKSNIPANILLSQI